MAFLGAIGMQGKLQEIRDQLAVGSAMPVLLILLWGRTVSSGHHGRKWALFFWGRSRLGPCRWFTSGIVFGLFYLHRLPLFLRLVLSLCAIPLLLVRTTDVVSISAWDLPTLRGAHRPLLIPSNSCIHMLPMQLVLFASFVNHGPTFHGSFGRSAGKSLFVIVRILNCAMGAC